MSPPQKASVLTRSAVGASYLIGLQVVSRALTFLINQILLRFLSPDLLGLASQLELYSISVLTFSRESLRVALQRHGVGPDDYQDQFSKGAQAQAQHRQEQEAVNLAWVAVGLGPVFALGFGWLFLRNAAAHDIQVPLVREALLCEALGCLLELLTEPAFALAQLQLRYGVRAAAETVAAVARCIVTCGAVLWARHRALDLGPMPFALGQLAFALALVVMYLLQLQPWRLSISLRPHSIQYKNLKHYFPPAVAGVAAGLYAQSGLKHILTQGDALLTSTLTSYHVQGVYALASSYGSLLARMVFQPIEESSRGLFGRLLSDNATDDDARSARSSLVMLMRAYSLLSLVIVALGPSLAPLLLYFIAGPAWAQTDASATLSLYCYYLPFLAFNGVLEAFVSAVATVDELKVQSRWMLIFSGVYASAGIVLLKVYQQGAAGLVGTNVLNMAFRIVWSLSFIRKNFARRKTPIAFSEALPTATSIAIALGTAVVLQSRSLAVGSLAVLAQACAIGAVFGLLLLVAERNFVQDLIQLVRPSAVTVQSEERMKQKS